MIVCTCDTCGRVVDNWTTLRIDMGGQNSLSEHREVCYDCQKNVKQQTLTFLDSITVTNINNNDQ